MNFRKLPGLPPYGPQALTFPDKWGLGAREGLVVEFTPDEGEPWVGNFRPGVGGIDEVLRHPNNRDVLVLSNASLWIVNPTTRAAVAIDQWITGYWQLTEPAGYLFNNQDLSFFRLSAQGALWQTRRMSWDGFEELRLEGELLTGKAWTPMDDAWVPFTLDLRTGRVEGGTHLGGIPDIPVCALLPSAFWLDRDFSRKEFEETLDFDGTDQSGWIVRASCRDCGQRWRVDHSDGRNVALAIKVTEPWTAEQDRSARIEYLRRSFGGDDNARCVWAGCSNRALRGVAMCAEHGFDVMGIRAKGT